MNLQRIFITAIILVCIIQTISSQIPKRFSTLDGLPSNEVYGLLQSSKGFVWVMTDRGVVKFDGNTFESYDKRNGFSGNCVFDAVEDPNDGSIWFRSLNRGVTVINGEQIISTKIKSKLTHWNEVGFLKSSKQGVFASATNQGDYKLKVDLYVDAEGLSYEENIIKTDSNHITKSINQWLEKNCTNCTNKVGHIDFKNGIASLYTKTSQSTITGPISSGSVKTSNIAGLTLGKTGAYLLKVDQFLFSIKDSLVKAIHIPGIRSLAYDEDSKLIYVGLSRFQGLSVINQELDLSSLKSIHPNIEVNDILIDREKNLWYATKSGLYLIQEPSFTNRMLQYNLANHPIYKLEYLEKFNQIYFLSSEERPYIVENNEEATPLIIMDSPVGFGYLEKDKLLLTSEVLNSSKSPLIWHDGVNQHTTYANLKSNETHGIGVIKAITEFQSKIWLAGSHGLGFIKGDTLSILPDFYGLRISAIHNFQESLIIGGEFGLIQVTIDKNAIIQSKLLDDTYISDISSSGTHLFISTFDNGVHLYNDEDSSFQQIEANLSTRVTTALKYLDNVLWIGTNRGVASYNLTTRVTTEYDKNSGLRSGYTYDLEAIGEDIWIATESGITSFTPGEINAARPGIYLEIKKLKIKDQQFFSDQIPTFTGGVDNLYVQLNGVYFKSPKDLRYSYKRTQKDTGWQKMEGNELFLTSLRPGKYDILFKVETSNGIKNLNPVRLNFTIKPHWWQVRPVQYLSMAILFAILCLLVIFRQKRKTQKRVLLAKIGDYRHQALVAQLNPHFIFNSLNSIQNFILQNNAKEAASFLSKFASLMRIMLRQAATRSISLEEEIESIRRYCELEQLRLKEKLEFSISLDSGLDLHKVEVPGMILQPFVENAILHGIQPKEGGGKVDLRVFGIENGILCVISDNGVGREHKPDQKLKIEKKASFGGAIAKQRIDLGNKGKKSFSFRIEDKIDDEGNSLGTDVFITILDKNEK